MSRTLTYGELADIFELDPLTALLVLGRREVTFDDPNDLRMIEAQERQTKAAEKRFARSCEHRRRELENGVVIGPSRNSAAKAGGRAPTRTQRARLERT